mmetsp:Transcript_11072/g.15358  ORF Transcript_11072/g.15358 Transcript_11072/m.15358 type:complete len:184 (-) Transcript_11072:906-1457(-)
MERWAKDSLFKDKVFFLTLSLAGPGLARTFADRYQLKKVQNAYIENEWEMPTSGQLGCQGFLIFNKEGTLVVPKSEPFLDVGEIAFRDVEFQLQTLLAKNDEQGEESAVLEEGQEVKIIRLTRHARVNGTLGIVKGYDKKENRYNVLLSGQSKTHQIRPFNILPLSRTVRRKKQRTSTSTSSS